MLQTAQPGVLLQTSPETVSDAWPESLDRQTRFQQVLHDNHWTDRHRIIASLIQDPTQRLHPLARRLNSCGNGASLFIDPDAGKPKAWISRCGSKLCPFCSNARTAHTRDELLPLILEHGCDRVMVLTQRSNDLPLRDQVTSLLAAFKRLRRTRFWRDRVAGGVRNVEFTMNEKTHQWHPHIHLLWRGGYVLHRLLQREWKRITCGSNMVRVNKVKDAQGMTAEMSKYLGKMQHIAHLTPYEIRQYAAATKGLRMIQTFGDCHNRCVHDSDKPQSKPRTDHRLPLSTLIHLARNALPTPMKLVALVAQRMPIFRYYIWHEFPQLNPDHDDNPPVVATDHRPGAARAPPEIKSDTDLDPELLDADIAATYWVFLAEQERGDYSHVHSYYQTRTEDLNCAVRG